MAEYVDRDEVLEYRDTVVTDDYSGNEMLDVVLTEEILGLTPANVVEREKIDKAIEEMTRLLDSTNNIDLENRTYDCIEILKRCIEG